MRKIDILIIATSLQMFIFDNETILHLSFENQEILQFKVKKIFFSNLTVPLWGPPRGQFFIRFFRGRYFAYKRPQLSETAKIRAITPGS